MTKESQSSEKGRRRMGSRIMHLIIADQIASKYTIKDKQAFLIGGIAPDAVYPKTKSHFYVGSEENYTTSIDFDAFLEKYPEKSDYILGYYTHLIADYIWVKGFYQGWLKNRMDQDKTLHGRYHEDFRVLNGKLLHYYQIDQKLLADINSVSFPDLEEVKNADVEAFIPYVLEDMNYSKADLDAELQVFTFQQMIGYIETSVHVGIMRMQDIGK
jgi:Zinc dependent phospholipase C